MQTGSRPPQHHGPAPVDAEQAQEHDEQHHADDEPRKVAAGDIRTAAELIHEAIRYLTATERD